MTVGADIAAHTQRKAAVMALGIAGASLTDDQITLLASVFAGQSASTIKAMFDNVLPAERDRVGILLPYLTEGTVKDYPIRVKDVVCLVVGLYSLKSRDSLNIVENLTGIMHSNLMEGVPAVKAIGSRRMTFGGEGIDGPTPTWVRNWADSASPGIVWAAVGLAPHQLGLGLAGQEELKGNIPASSTAAYSRVTRDVPTSNAVLQGAEKDAGDMLESGRMPK